jgi:hypothetical protein
MAEFGFGVLKKSDAVEVERAPPVWKRKGSPRLDLLLLSLHEGEQEQEQDKEQDSEANLARKPEASGFRAKKLSPHGSAPPLIGPIF